MLGHAESFFAEDLADTLNIKTFSDPFLPDPKPQSPVFLTGRYVVTAA